MGRDNILEVGEDLLTPTEIQSQIPTNLEEEGKYVVGSELTREDMANIWSTKDLLGWDNRELLVWYNRLSYFSFK